MNLQEKKYYLGFSAFPGIGPVRVSLLKKYFGSAAKAYQAPKDELLKTGLPRGLVSEFVDFRSRFPLDDYLLKMEKTGVRAVTLDEDEYPALLKEIPDAPFVLYIKGKLGNQGKQGYQRDRVGDGLEIWQKTIAVVGTRKMTAYGQQATRLICQGLIGAGLTIVSGLAIGVDSTAHQTALDFGGKTIAVLGCGADVCYPRQNEGLYQQIVAGGGLIVSEMPLGHWALKGIFVARNRIISGLSKGVIVTEGAERSGSLITARYALEQGREVFAVPGPITSLMSAATAQLLKNGARAATRVEDVLEELGYQGHQGLGDRRGVGGGKLDNEVRKGIGVKRTVIKGESKEEQEIIEMLAKENLHLDNIVRQIRKPAGEVGSMLSLMEIKGMVKNIGGMVYGLVS